MAASAPAGAADAKSAGAVDYYANVSQSTISDAVVRKKLATRAALTHHDESRLILAMVGSCYVYLHHTPPRAYTRTPARACARTHTFTHPPTLEPTHTHT